MSRTSYSSTTTPISIEEAFLVVLLRFLQVDDPSINPTEQSYDHQK
jgi:hypothetical protein